MLTSVAALLTRKCTVVTEKCHGERFSELVSPLDARIEVAVRESETLAELRDTLLPKLISGEIRTPVAEGFAGETVDRKLLEAV